jgi:hypothetical protein
MPAPPDAAPHLRLTAGGVALLVRPAGALASSDPDADALEAALRAHNALLAIHAREGEVLPLGFATLVPGRQAALELLDRRAPAFRTALSRLAGRQEFTVEVLQRPEDTVPPGPEDGRGYLRGRAAERRRAEAREAALAAAFAEAEAAVAGVAGAHVAHTSPPGQPGGGRRLGLAALVPRARLPALREALSRIATAAEGVALRLTGPWPPYSFAAEAMADTTEAGA